MYKVRSGYVVYAWHIHNFITSRRLTSNKQSQCSFSSSDSFLKYIYEKLETVFDVPLPFVLHKVRLLFQAVMFAGDVGIGFGIGRYHYGREHRKLRYKLCDLVSHCLQVVCGSFQWLSALFPWSCHVTFHG